MTDRKYLPTLAELIDRLSIVQLKMIFIAENRVNYIAERALIEHDIDALLTEGFGVDSAKAIRAVMLIMLANRFIWERESIARKGGVEAEGNLRATHAVNGVRNTAKNIIAALNGHRVDLKVDALAADLPPDLGNWDVFRD